MDASLMSQSLCQLNISSSSNNNNKKRSQVEISRNIMIKKKMKKMHMNRCRNQSNANANGDISNNNAIDEDFVVHEILSRLPVKTLMRFKSVCKGWKSSIQHDPLLHQLHFKHSETHRPLRLFSIPFPYETVTGYEVSDASLIKKIAFHTFRAWDKLLSVNGLACLVNNTRNAVRIYNPSTREETQWIQTITTLPNHAYGQRFFLQSDRRFLFGYDPVTKKHKVLCYDRTKSAASEILTVGDNSWRRVDHDPQVPINNTYASCVYVNGAIYWMGNISHKHDASKQHAPQVLVAFDVGSEKFRVIPIPEVIINQRRGPLTDDLLEVNGRVALLRRRNKNTASMWMFDDDHHRHNHHCRNWTDEMIIRLHFNWVGKDTYVCFYNAPGTDQIIVHAYMDDRWDPCAYSYNWKTGTSEKLEVSTSEIPSRDKSLPQPLLDKVPFVESLFPVM